MNAVLEPADRALASRRDVTAPGASTGVGRARRLAIASVLGAVSLVVFSTASTHVALPALARAFLVTPAESVRVLGAHQLGLVIALMPSAALGERFGHRTVLTAGLAVFTIAAALGALAPSLPWLVAARFVQGLGGAAVLALAVALLRAVVAPSELGAAIGWNALVVALSSAAAPAVGSLLLSRASWPWLFAAQVPVGVAALLAARSLPDAPDTTRALDPASMALGAVALGGAFGGAELLRAHALLGAGVLALALVGGGLLLRRELPKQTPLVPLDLLRRVPFRVSVIASVVCFAGQTAALVSLPFLLVGEDGADDASVGLLLTAWPLSVAVVAPLAGRLADRLSTAWLAALGGTALAAGLGALALAPALGSALAVVPLLALCGVGFGLFQVSNNRNMFLAAPRARAAAAGGAQGTARLTGQTAGTSLVALLFSIAPLEVAARRAMAVAAVLTWSAGMISLLRAEPRAAGMDGRVSE